MFCNHSCATNIGINIKLFVTLISIALVIDRFHDRFDFGVARKIFHNSIL